MTKRVPYSKHEDSSELQNYRPRSSVTHGDGTAEASQATPEKQKQKKQKQASSHKNSTSWNRPHTGKTQKPARSKPFLTAAFQTRRSERPIQRKSRV